MRQRKIILFLALLCIPFAVSRSVNAMHIMEGYLQPKYCIAWGILCIPFLLAGFLSLKRLVSEHKKAIIILAMSGAYTFVLSALKLPSVTGSSSHPTGTGLGAILLGPSIMSILGIIVLLFQALLLAHGGLTTLGANTFSMAIVGPFAAYGIYRFSRKCNVNKMVAVFLAAAIGDLITYVVTAFQLALAYPSKAGGMGASFSKFLGIFAITQIPIAIIEGILTVIVIMALESYARPELKELSFLKEVAVHEQ